MIDEHRHRPGEVCFRFHEVGVDVLALEILLRQLTEAVATDLADEACRHARAAGPHRHVRGTAAGGEHHLAERIATSQQLAVGADEHVPGEVADDAHGLRPRLAHDIGHGGHRNSYLIARNRA